MPIALESDALQRVLSELKRGDPTLASDAEGAVDWLMMGESDDEPLVLTRRRLQLFLWYELPRKWLLPDDELVRVPAALAELLERAGPDTAP